MTIWFSSAMVILGTVYITKKNKKKTNYKSN